MLPLNIPVSPKEMNRKLISGSRSLLNNLPRPPIHQLSDGHHVYISLIDIIRDLLGHGRHIEPLDAHMKSGIHSKSIRGNEIINCSLESFGINTSSGSSPPCVILPIYLWRDGFDPFNVKKNRGSAWCMVASVATPQSTIHSGCNTYLSALGPSKHSHANVEKLLRQDLEILASGGLQVYHGGSCKTIPVYAQIYSIQEDRPEKSSHTHTSAGNSSFHARFGYAGNISAVSDKLPSCVQCNLARMNGVVPLLPCSLCYDWSFSDVRYKAPKEYPVPNNVQDWDGLLPVKRITFKSLQDAVAIAHTNVLLGKWNVTKAKCFLATEGVSTILADNVTKLAKECSNHYSGDRNNENDGIVRR